MNAQKLIRWTAITQIESAFDDVVHRRAEMEEAYPRLIAAVEGAMEADGIQNRNVNGLQRFQSDLMDWAERQFPGQSTAGKICHLEREVQELKAAPTDTMEMADCLILLLQVAARAGVSAIELVAVAEMKLAINKHRAWGEMDAEGVVSHVEDRGQGLEGRGQGSGVRGQEDSQKEEVAA